MVSLAESPRRMEIIDPQGPYRCRGSFLRRELVDPALRYGSRRATLDRHGSFFRWKDGWYFICNDMSRTGTPYFRDSSICRVEYGPGGEILPVRLSSEGAELD